jgi:hypothetical protein
MQFLCKCFFFNPLVDPNTVTGSLTYSTITDNNATVDQIVVFWNQGSQNEMKSCNVLRNTQVYAGSRAIIFTWGYLVIEDSCILENRANLYFYESSKYCTITVSNCTVDNFASYGNITTKNLFTKSFIHALDHMSTRHCYTGFDSVGNLTPISHISKQKHCYTGDRSFYHIKQANFVFIFNFIHSCDSIGSWY